MAQRNRRRHRRKADPAVEAPDLEAEAARLAKEIMYRGSPEPGNPQPEVTVTEFGGDPNDTEDDERQPTTEFIPPGCDDWYEEPGDEIDDELDEVEASDESSDQSGQIGTSEPPESNGAIPQGMLDGPGDEPLDETDRDTKADDSSDVGTEKPFLTHRE